MLPLPRERMPQEEEFDVRRWCQGTLFGTSCVVVPRFYGKIGAQERSRPARCGCRLDDLGPRFYA